MGFFNNLKQRLFGNITKYPRHSFGYVMSGSRATKMLGAPVQANYKSYLEQYADASWIYSCIYRITTKALSVNYKLVKKTAKNGKQILTDIIEHPILDVLNKPNENMTKSNLQQATFTHEELTGNAYWLLDEIKGGKPTKIHPLRPDRVKIIPDAHNFIKHYEYSIDQGKTIRLAPEEVIHFKFYNPEDDHYGLSPLAAARVSLDTLQAGDEYNKQFFNNSAIPKGALSTELGLTQEQRQQIRHAWNDRHGGIANSHKIAVLEGGLKWTNIGLSQKDMDFISQKKLTREDILSVFGVPPVMVGIFEYANYANSKEQREIFWRDTMVPLIAAYIDTINHYLVYPWDDSLKIVADLTGIAELQEDVKMKAEIDEIHTRSGIKTINEIRAELGLDPVAWGSTWHAPLNLSPINPDGSQPRPEDAEKIVVPKKKVNILADPEHYMPKFEEWKRRAKKIDVQAKVDQIKKDMESIAKKLHAEKLDQLKANEFKQRIQESHCRIGSPKIQISKTKSEETPEEKATKRRDKKWGQFKDLTDRLERDWREELRKFFTALKTEVLINLEDTNLGKMYASFRLNKKADFDEVIFDMSEANKEAKRLAKEQIEVDLVQSAAEQITDLGLGISFDLTNPEVQKWIDEKSFAFAKEVNSTTRNQLRATLKEGVEAGEGIPALQKRIDTIFTTATTSRTTMIARTETLSATNAGALFSYEQSGVVEQKEWISSRDDRVREAHQVADGETVGLRESFSNGLRFPGDPSGSAAEVVNCRCTISGVVKV